MPVADAEDGHAELKRDLRRARGPQLHHRGRPAGEDDGAGAEFGDALRVGIEGHDLAIDAGLAHAPRDQLRHLAAEIENQDALAHGARIIPAYLPASKPYIRSPVIRSSRSGGSG